MFETKIHSIPKRMTCQWSKSYKNESVCRGPDFCFCLVHSMILRQLWLDSVSLNNETLWWRHFLSPLSRNCLQSILTRTGHSSFRPSTLSAAFAFTASSKTVTPSWRLFQSELKKRDGRWSVTSRPSPCTPSKPTISSITGPKTTRARLSFKTRRQIWSRQRTMKIPVATTTTITRQTMGEVEKGRVRQFFFIMTSLINSREHPIY